MIVYVLLSLALIILARVFQGEFKGNTRLKVIFAWYDIWVGIFYDRKSQSLYLLLLPTLGIVIRFNYYKNVGTHYAN